MKCKRYKFKYQFIDKNGKLVLGSQFCAGHNKAGAQDFIKNFIEALEDWGATNIKCSKPVIKAI